MLLLVA